MKKLLVVLAAVALLVMGVAGLGHATIIGEIWQYDTTNSAATDTATLTGPHAEFTVGTISFDSSANGFTASSFLGNPTFTNLTSGLDNDGNTVNFDPNLNLSVGGYVWGSIIKFTGGIYLDAGDNLLSITHDDGVVLTIAGTTVINSPGPTSEITSSGNFIAATAGCYAYTLEYNECNGAPAVIKFLHSECVVPLPGALLLLGAGLVRLGAYGRKKRQAAA